MEMAFFKYNGYSCSDDHIDLKVFISNEENGPLSFLLHKIKTEGVESELTTLTMLMFDTALSV